MNKLLTAEFSRLFKSTIFRIILIAAALFAFFQIAVNYAESGSSYKLESFISEGLLLDGIITAVFIGLFIGREHSDSTLHNKIIAGHKRIDIYLSELVVCTAAGFIVKVVYIVLFAVPALIIFGGFFASFKDIAIVQLLGLCVSAAYTALFLPISMLMQSKASGLVISIILSLVMLLGGSYVYIKLSGQLTDAEISELKEYCEEYGTDYDFDLNQLTDKELRTFQFLNDFLLSAQQTNITDFGIPDNAEKYPLYDGAVIVVTTLCGIFLFCRKDIRTCSHR